MNLEKKELYKAPQMEHFYTRSHLLLSSLSVNASFEDVDFFEPAFEDIDFIEPS